MTMKRFINKNSILAVSYVAIFVLILVGTFADLEVSKSLAVLNKGEYYTHSLFAAFFEVVGEMPVYILPSTAAFIIMQYLLQGELSKAKRYTIIFIAFLVVFALNIFASFKLVLNAHNYVNLGWVYSGIFQYFIYILVSAIFTLFCYIISMWLTNKGNLKNLAICSLIVIFTAILSQIVTQSIKPFALRARYRYMNYLGNFSLYSPWYDFNANNIVGELAKKDYFKSFPSGHTTAAAMMLTLILFTTSFGEFKKRYIRSIIISVAVLFPVVVGFSRIQAGAHYLTDVSFGLLITLTAMLISKWAVNKWLAKFFE